MTGRKRRFHARTEVFDSPPFDVLRGVARTATSHDTADKGFRDVLHHTEVWGEDPSGIELFGVAEWSSFDIRLVDKWVFGVDRQTPLFSTNSATNIHSLSFAE
ncbi:hypothetical protein SUTMEG_12400 [Sutterella megalosphaeroides]|uniref:Uncharacterized protein n=1 Tax=Sutterella megalosphaeroides TaxID=2494234 RepID=A0A2Z6IAA8_9BURK|nr:hypothetical protein SUTMEG_12400 [Sutterella megalosphaeroides]